MARLKNTVVSDTSNLTLPGGTNVQRTITTYTTPGSYTWTAPTGVTQVQVLVVAGGGGGGWGASNADGNGGGGAGGVVYNSAYTVVPGNNYSVTVGAGGATPSAAANSARGSSGGNSIFDTITAYGGGGGGSDTTNAGIAGGSGGGAGCGGSGGPYSGGTGTAGQGNAGGQATAGAGPGGGGGGGGGAGTTGFPGLGSNTKGGNGGQGALYAIAGNPTWYGGGGGGSSWTHIGGTGGAGGGGNGASRTISPYVSTMAAANTGGGGGAGTATYAGTAGGSGIVIISFASEVVEIFSKPGTTTTWTCPSDVTSVEVLVVGGGGGASGGDYATGGGGGGGGGVLYNSAYNVVPGTGYTVTVGAGGASVTGNNAAGNAGGSSIFATLTASGGGRGAAYSTISAGSGSSGGGGSYQQNSGGAGTTGQGYPGGTGGGVVRSGGGGGGAGGPGADSTDRFAGKGGDGFLCSITGYPTYYGGGGGGGAADWTDPPSLSGRKPGAPGLGGGGGGGQAIANTGASIAGGDGVPGTGGGAGGSAFNVSTANAGAIYSAAGGSGIVIIKYRGVSAYGSNNRGIISHNTTSQMLEHYNGNYGWRGTGTTNEIVGKGLINHWDAGNPKSKVFYPQKLLDDNTWNLGTGDVGQFYLNGVNAANQRLVDTDPWGRKAIIWEGRAQATNTGEGGWNTSYFTIDPYKPYRWAQWIRRTVIGNGTTYFGTNSVLNCSDRSANGNPYFYATGWPVQQNQWYLWIAHTFPNSRASGQTNPHYRSGLYTVEGGADYKMYGGGTDYITNGTSVNQRTYLYYTTDSSGRQQFFRPRVDALDGTEPSLEALLKDEPVDPYIWYDIKGIGHMIMVNNNITYDAQYKSLVYNGSNSYTRTQLQQFTNWTNGGSFEMWYCIHSYKDQGFMSISNTPSYLNFYMPSTGGNAKKLRWEVIGNTASSYNAIFGTTEHQLGRWYHAVGVFDKSANTTALYINGVLEASQSSYTNTPTNYTSYIETGNYGGYLDGKMAICRIYNRPLTVQEINQNFNAERGRFGI